MAIGSNAAALVVEGGKHKGEKVSFGQEGATLGRSSKSTLTLRMGAGVSRHHAQIVFIPKEGAFTIEDLGSRNGTSVNGAPVKAPTFLRDRDLIEISAERIRFIGPSPKSASGDDAMPPPGFGLDEDAPHSQMADVTAPSMAPAKFPQTPPPPPVGDDRLPPPPLSPPPSPPLSAPRSPPPPPVSEEPAPPSVAEPSIPAPTAPPHAVPPHMVDGGPSLLPPQPTSLPPALPQAAAEAYVAPEKGGGGSSVILFALGIFLGVLGIGAAFAIDAFVLDGMVAQAVFELVGLEAESEEDQTPTLPTGPTVEVKARGGGEIKSLSVAVGDKIKSGDVVGTVARDGPEDPKRYRALLKERARLQKLTKSKRKKTRRLAKAKLAKVKEKVAKAEAGPMKVYNLRSEHVGVVTEVVAKIGTKLEPGGVVLKLVQPGASGAGTAEEDGSADGAKGAERANAPADDDAKAPSEE